MDLLKKQNKISPILEIIRGIKYENILKSFVSDCSYQIGTNVFSKKKTCIRTLTNILASWMFSLYSNYDFKSDPFFPDDCSDTDNLRVTLINFSKFDKNIKNNEKIIDNIINNLKENYKKNLEEMDKINKLDLNDERFSDYKIKKEVKIFERNYKTNKKINFYKFEIDHKEEVKFNRLINIIDNILIPVDIYEKLKNKFLGEKELFDVYVWIMIYRYQLLGSNNNQLGVLPDVLNKMKNDFDLNFELFGSSINFTMDNYCSLYFDIEEKFGSKGSFFNYDIKSGVYNFNPPYQNDIIEKGVNRLFYYLEKNDKECDDNNRLSFVLTIPIWDNTGKKIMKYKYPEKRLIQEIDYGDFEIIKNIEKSKYFRLKIMISKNNFTYLDHNFSLFKNSTIQNTYVFVLSNDKKRDFEKLHEYNYKDF